MERIAQLSGVSKITVSRALRTPELVKESTRNRIQEIIEQENYVYNAAAADLSSESSSLIGLIIPSVKSSIFADYIDGIDSAIRKTRFSLLIGYTDFNITEEAEVIRTFLERNVRALITVGIQENNRDLYRQARRQGITVINTWEYAVDSEFHCVGFDNESAAYRITKYIADLGHQRIGMIMGPYSVSPRVQSRYIGFTKALEDAGLEVDERYVIEKLPTFEEGKEAMERLLSLPSPPTAVFAASDTLAIGAIKAARARGFRVPEDVSVAGFDNLDLAYFFEPSITTIRVPAYEMGRIATTIVTETNQNPADVRRYCLDTDLIVRNSCSPPTGEIPVAATTGGAIIGSND